MPSLARASGWCEVAAKAASFTPEPNNALKEVSP
jgi:hypothetical protein